MSYAKWKDRLAGKKVPTFTQPDENDEGYYRIPKREKVLNAQGERNGQSKIVGWSPVAYFLVDGVLEGNVGPGERNRPMTGNEVIDLWTHCCAYPISYETYKLVAEQGQPWPDMAAGPILSDNPVPAANREVAKTDNNPAEELPLDQQHAEGIKNAIGAALKEVKTEADAAAALGSKNRLAELRLAAEKVGKALYDPPFREYKRLHGLWTPMVALASDAEKRIDKAILTFRQAERNRIAAEQEAARKLAEQQEVARLAELARINELNERAADRAIAKGEPEPMPVLPEPIAPAPEPVVATLAPVVPAYGARKLKEEERWWLDAIEDQDAVYNHFKANPKVLALLTELATSAVKTGVTVPGTKTHKGLV